MQPTTCKNDSQAIVRKPFPQPTSFGKSVINRRDFIYLGILKMFFTF